MVKEIIINGVDVSGCCQYTPRYMEDYDIDTLDYCKHHFKPCKDVDVKYCYYKQLKHKEQECEELKHKVELMMDCASCKVDEYKQTLIEIKEIAKEQIPYLNITDTKTMIEVEYDYADEICNLKQRMDKILQKISECEGGNGN